MSLYILVPALFLSATLLAAEGNYYPKSEKKQLQIGDEDYKSKNVALLGITGVYIADEILKSSAAIRGLSIDSELIERVQNKLAAVGIKTLSKEDIEAEPGQPRLDIYPNFPAFIDDDNGFKVIENLACCRASVWMQFTQGGKILTTPDANLRLGTWGDGADTNDCDNLGNWIGIAIEEKIDKFIEDYRQASNSAREKEAAALAEVERYHDSALQQCNGAPILYTAAFAANSPSLMNARLPDFVELADIVKRCEHYHYAIETHSYQRGDTELNRRLSQQRAAALTHYLLALGAPEERFDVSPRGEEQLLVAGEDEAAHAINRRVFVSPTLLD
ncbi:MAG: OmpA family protein [Pseudomonadota bacterium]